MSKQNLILRNCHCERNEVGRSNLSVRLLRANFALAMTRVRLSCLVVFLSILFLSPLGFLYAQQTYDIKELTPEVKSALDSRRERFEELKVLKSKGALGENNKGYVEALNDDSEAKSLAKAENKDRKFIYQTIAEQNGLPAGAISTIEIVFAQVQRDKARSGDRIQDADGNWTSKE